MQSGCGAAYDSPAAPHRCRARFAQGHLLVVNNYGKPRCCTEKSSTVAERKGVPPDPG